MKKRFPLQPEECDRFDDLSQTLLNWDPAKTLVASELATSELAREFNAVGTDSSHKINPLTTVSHFSGFCNSDCAWQNLADRHKFIWFERAL